VSEEVVTDEAELSVGELLRSTREARGGTLEEASRITRIARNYLVAMEEGRFDKLPNAAYLKGFLRLYAGYLALPPDEIIGRYERFLSQSLPLKPGVSPELPVFEAMERVSLGGYGRWLLPLILLGLVLLAALFFMEEKPASPPPLRVPAPGRARVAPPVQPKLSSAALPPIVPPVVVEQPKGHEESAHGIILRLRFNRDSWLSITIDRSVSQHYDLKAGDVIEWKGERNFLLDLGDGAAAEGEFNGRPLKALGEAGKPAHLELKGNDEGN
jgi:transcriptional regulator with XRE-family HTH domain